MKRLTYKEAYDKIIEAYFKDEIKPFNANFCFCGTLSPDMNWDRANEPENDVKYPYLKIDYARMEQALLSRLDGVVLYNISLIATKGKDGKMVTNVEWFKEHESDYEDMLFEAMSAALEVLKEIHQSRGENVDEEVLPFTKRNLKPVNV